jgi:Bacterial Ig domain
MTKLPVAKFIRNINLVIIFILTLSTITLAFVSLNVDAALSTNLITDQTSYIGGIGDDFIEGSEIDKDNNVFYGGNNTDLNQNYGKNPINISGGGEGVLLHFNSDGKTLKSIFRFPSRVKDISADKTENKIAVIGDFGLFYIDTNNNSVLWSKTLPKDNSAHPDNLKEGTRVDIGNDGKIASLYGKRITVWDKQGNNLSGNNNETFSVNSKFITDIALVSENNTVVVVGETQKDVNPFCLGKWRAAWMKGMSYTGSVVWNNYDWSVQQASGNLAEFPVNNCADAMPKRVVLGRDNKLYMIAESAGGNSIFRYDPKNLNISLASVNKVAGGDNHNNSSNMQDQHISFMMKYEPTNGDIIKQQLFISRLENTGGNSLFPYGISVNEDGIIGFVGRGAAFIPDRRFGTFTLNGGQVPPYGDGGDGFYIELLPDMRTRLRTMVFKNAKESDLRTVTLKGERRVVGGFIKGSGGTIFTKNPIQAVSGGGSNEGLIASWGFTDTQKDFILTGSIAPNNLNLNLGSQFNINYDLSYSGNSSYLENTKLVLTLPPGIRYENAIYDGFICSSINSIQTCEKPISKESFSSNIDQSLTMYIPSVLEDRAEKEISLSIQSLNNSDLDQNISNNLINFPLKILPSFQQADYILTSELMNNNPIALNAFAEIKYNYSYVGPTPITDKRFTIVFPEGLRHDPANRAGMQCSVSGNVQTCIKNLLQTNLRYGNVPLTIYAQATNPTVGSANKTIIASVTDGTNPIIDSNSSNHQNIQTPITVNPMIYSGDYQISFLTLNDTNININESTSPKMNIKYIGNSSGVSQKLTVTIPKGFRYEYIQNIGFKCSIANETETCTKTISAEEWLQASNTNGLNLDLNLKADSQISGTNPKTIIATLSPTSGNSQIDQTPINNTTSINLRLENIQPCTNGATNPPSCNICPNGYSLNNNICELLNQAPTVSLTSPSNNQVFNKPQSGSYSINFQAQASDVDGTISKVEFYLGNTKLGEDIDGSNGYNFVWNNVVLGNHQIYAKAFDNDGANTLSAVKNISVIEEVVCENGTINPPSCNDCPLDQIFVNNQCQQPNTVPQVNIVSPINNSVYQKPQSGAYSINFQAQASDVDGTISKVEFYLGNTKLGEDIDGSNGYNFVWNNVVLGNHQIYAKAFDNDGASKNSAFITFTVTEPQPCENGAINSPTCNICPLGQEFNGNNCVLLARNITTEDINLGFCSPSIVFIDEKIVCKANFNTGYTGKIQFSIDNTNILCETPEIQKEDIEAECELNFTNVLIITSPKLATNEDNYTQKIQLNPIKVNKRSIGNISSNQNLSFNIGSQINTLKLSNSTLSDETNVELQINFSGNTQIFNGKVINNEFILNNPFLVTGNFVGEFPALLNIPNQNTILPLNFNLIFNSNNSDSTPPVLEITDPYICGSSIFGKVSDNSQGDLIVRIRIVSASNNYIFEVSPNLDGEYELLIQSANPSNPFFVSEGDYTVFYSASDENGNQTQEYSYPAKIRNLENCNNSSSPSSSSQINSLSSSQNSNVISNQNSKSSLPVKNIRMLTRSGKPFLNNIPALSILLVFFVTILIIKKRKEIKYMIKYKFLPKK